MSDLGFGNTTGVLLLMLSLMFVEPYHPLPPAATPWVVELRPTSPQLSAASRNAAPSGPTLSTEDPESQQPAAELEGTCCDLRLIY